MHPQQVERLFSLLERLVAVLERQQGVWPGVAAKPSSVFCRHEWWGDGAVCSKCGAVKYPGNGG